MTNIRPSPQSSENGQPAHYYPSWSLVFIKTLFIQSLNPFNFCLISTHDKIATAGDGILSAYMSSQGEKSLRGFSFGRTCSKPSTTASAISPLSGRLPAPPHTASISTEFGPAVVGFEVRMELVRDKVLVLAVPFSLELGVVGVLFIVVVKRVLGLKIDAGVELVDRDAVIPPPRDELVEVSVEVWELVDIGSGPNIRRDVKSSVEVDSRRIVELDVEVAALVGFEVGGELGTS